jgi:hypothetical protein
MSSETCPGELRVKSATFEVRLVTSAGTELVISFHTPESLRQGVGRVLGNPLFYFLDLFWVIRAVWHHGCLGFYRSRALPGDSRTGSGVITLCGLETRDTADWKSALRPGDLIRLTSGMPASDEARTK